MHELADLRHRQDGQFAIDVGHERHPLVQGEEEAADRLHAAPGTGEAGQGRCRTLPPPQDSVVTAANPNGRNRPRQRLARLRADADANVDNPNYNSPIVSDVAVASTEDRRSRRTARPGAPSRRGNASRGGPEGPERRVQEPARRRPSRAARPPQISERAAARLPAGLRRRAGRANSARTRPRRNAA